MIKNIIAVLLLFSLASGTFISATYGFEPEGTVLTGSDGGGTGGDCNWDAYLDKLADQEQLPQNKCGDNPTDECKARQYVVIRDDPNPLNNGTRDASWGRFQFIPGTWAAQVQSEYPQCVRYTSTEALPGGIGATKNDPYKPYAISPDCWDVQDYAAAKFSEKNRQYAEENNWCGLLGVTVTDAKFFYAGSTTMPPCTITESGILSALHNAGRNCSLVASDGKTGRHLRARACDASGRAIPSACTPSAPSDVPVFATPFEGEVQEAPTYTPIMKPVLSDGLKSLWVATLQNMTAQIVSTMMQQVQIIGTFFDAKHQLETQRLIQQKTALAHQKYQPSEQMCTIGTFVRGLGQSERRAAVTQAALARSMIDRALKLGDASTYGLSTDEETIESTYLSAYCTPSDNAGQNTELCTGEIASAMVNADIDYTRSISSPLTLDVDLFDDETTPDETTIFAVMDQLFMHNSFPPIVSAKTELTRFVEVYLEMRSLVAMRSVAQNSLAFIVAEKSASSPEADNIAPFLRSMMVEMGIEADLVDDMIGENPSHYAQMEFLTRKIYYHPEFISNLYDKPANVRRMVAAMTAIKSMQNWQITEALKRREMLTSILLELKLREKQMELESKDIPQALNPRQVRDILNNIGQ